MSAVAVSAPSLPDPVSHRVVIPAYLADMPQGWTIKKVETNSLKTDPGPAGLTHRIAVWLDEWSMRSFSHDSHHPSAKHEVLRGLKNMGHHVGH